MSGGARGTSASRRSWPMALAAIAAAVVVTKVILEDVLGLTWSGVLDTALSRPGVGTAAVVVAILAVDLLLPVPSSIVMVASGALFGIVTGGCLSLAGSLLGNYLGFEIARGRGRAALERWIGAAQVKRMEGVFERHGALAIVASRPVPILMETVSLAAGLSNMRRQTFLVASLAGTAPIVFLYAYAGARSVSSGTILPAAVMLVAVAAFGWAIARPLGLRVY